MASRKRPVETSKGGRKAEGRASRGTAPSRAGAVTGATARKPKPVTAKPKGPASGKSQAKVAARAGASARPRHTFSEASIAALRVKEIEALRREVEGTRLPRWNADPEDVQKSVAQLVLALVEFLRKLLERQAIRRMDAESLSPDEVERIGLALMRLEETVHDLAARFGLSPEELNVDLGPLGRLS